MTSVNGRSIRHRLECQPRYFLAYYERCLALLRTGGFLLIDNTLWSGAVADPSNCDPVTETLRTPNGKVHADPRVEMVLIPIGDGLTLARKISCDKANWLRKALHANRS
jgi:predicted O-methyltransferase YrrM